MKCSTVTEVVITSSGCFPRGKDAGIDPEQLLAQRLYAAGQRRAARDTRNSARYQGTAVGVDGSARQAA